MKVIREIPREELSPNVLDFCDNNPAYLVEEKVMPVSKGKPRIREYGPFLKTIFKIKNLSTPTPYTFEKAISMHDSDQKIEM